MKKVLLSLAVTLILISCTHKHDNLGSPGEAPVVTTDSVTDITTTSAVSGGNISGSDSLPLTGRGIQWAMDPNFTNSRETNASSAVNFAATMSGLSPATTYYVRAYATNAAGTGYGSPVEFTTNYASSDYTVSTYAVFPDPTTLAVGVALGPNGTMYGAGYKGEVWKIAANGTVALLENFPSGSVNGIVADAQGKCYVLVNRVIVRFTPDGTMSTFAGGGEGQVDGVGTAAGFDDLVAADIDTAGNIYLADGHRLRKIDPAGRVTTIYIAFTGTDSTVNSIALDKAQNIYFSTRYSIYRIDSLGQAITYIAGKKGSADGTGSSAAFTGIRGMRMNTDGNLIVCDENKVRVVTPAGEVTTLAGTVITGYQDGDANTAAFHYVYGLAIDANGIIYVADVDNACIRKIAHK